MRKDKKITKCDKWHEDIEKHHHICLIDFGYSYAFRQNMWKTHLNYKIDNIRFVKFCKKKKTKKKRCIELFSKMCLSWIIHSKIISISVILFHFILVQWHKRRSRSKFYIHSVIYDARDSLVDISPKRCLHYLYQTNVMIFNHFTPNKMIMLPCRKNYWEWLSIEW